MKSARIVPEVNGHRQMVSDFWCAIIVSRWRPWRSPATCRCIFSTVYAGCWLYCAATVPDPEYIPTC